MVVLVLTVLVTLVLVAGGVVLFVHRLRAGDFDHGERLALLPLEEDEIVPPQPVAGEAAETENAETEKVDAGGRSEH